MNEYVDIISINQYLGWYNKTEFGDGAKYGYHGKKINV